MLKKFPTLRILVCVVMLFTASATLSAQTEHELAQATVQAVTLFDKQAFAEALPHLEVLIKGLPDNPQVRFMYGFSLVAKSKQTSNEDEAKQLSVKALEALREAKRLGFKDQMNDTLIAMLSGQSAAPVGDEGPAYSLNKDAEKAMREAESLFAQSKYEEAVKLFDKALELDPKLYQAAVSGGDCFIQKGDWANAEKRYQKAIGIDPNRETAYRYSATPFMKQKKYDEARDRYIEAYVVEPYNRMSSRGINQWAGTTGKNLQHPAIDVPELTFDTKGKAIPKTAIDPKDAAASPWLAYLTARESWKNGKFAAAFPKEQQYRHSLPEEAESLRAAVKAAQSSKSANKQFETLAQLDKDGVLESYILLARANEGISEDHPAYLKDNRQKLKLYVANYVIQK